MTYSKDRNEAIEKMKVVLSSPFLVLDTETTGLDSDAEIIEIAVIDQDGNVLINTRVKPSTPIDEKGKAFAVNGIGNKEVETAPTFADIWPKLTSILNEDRLVAIYNADFDLRMIGQCALTLLTVNSNDLKFKACDVMGVYAAYVGDWSDYFGNYRYQKLPGGGHSALEDCRATLALIKRMAFSGITVGEA